MKRLFTTLAILSFMVACVSCSSDEKQSEQGMNNISSVDSESLIELDSTWECDYFKMGINSKWNIDDSISDRYSTSTIEWEDEERFHVIFISFTNSSLYKKLTQSESIDEWEKLKYGMLNDSDSDEMTKEWYETRSVSDSFVKNGQAYIIIDIKDLDSKEIEFYSDSLHGTIRYYSDDEEIIMNMIDTIEFY